MQLLSDRMWARIEPLLPDRAPRRGGRWIEHRQVVEAICWRFRTGSTWRDLPADFPAWQTVWWHFDRWVKDGTWVRVLAAGVPGHVRPQRQAGAERGGVSWPTANRWAQRYRVAGPAGMGDRSSRPHRVANRTPTPVVRKVVHLRWKQCLGPVEIGAKLGMPASTVHAVLVRCRLNKLWHIDRRTGEPIRRYEHDHPGSLLHVDVKKLGNVPDGGGWRYVGRQQGRRNKVATPGRARSPNHDPLGGTAFVHTVIDDHSRVAYAEIHDDETAATATAVLRRAVAWYAARGIRVERVLSDNASAYKSHLWRATCTELGITPKKTRPYRPQTNGKIERFHRTLGAGWAFKRFNNSETPRRRALPASLHEYNHHRPHTAIGKVPPITRLTNLPGQYN